ncbi:MAG: hypothetical protein IJG83_01725, partial [Thermoguttaceae bacterium]|nr:hypothetical protein [Thermoguttaceae bacterium]
GHLRITLPVFATKKIISTADEEEDPTGAAQEANLPEETFWAQESELPLLEDDIAELCASGRDGGESSSGDDTLALLLDELTEL